MSKDLTLSVPEAGKRYYRLSRNASYSAAARGEIPTIRVGRLLRVPVRAMERLLDMAQSRTADEVSSPCVAPAAVKPRTSARHRPKERAAALKKDRWR